MAGHQHDHPLASATASPVLGLHGRIEPLLRMWFTAPACKNGRSSTPQAEGAGPRNEHPDGSGGGVATGVGARAARPGRPWRRRGRGRLPGGARRRGALAPLPAADAHRHPVPAVRDDHRRHRPGLRRPRGGLAANPFVLLLAGFTLVMAVLMAARALGRAPAAAQWPSLPPPTRLLGGRDAGRRELGVPAPPVRVGVDRLARRVSRARRQEDDHDRGADPTRPAGRAAA